MLNKIKLQLHSTWLDILFLYYDCFKRCNKCNQDIFYLEKKYIKSNYTWKYQIKCLLCENICKEN